MAQDHSTTGLLASIRRRCMLPATDEALSNSDLLAMATEELQTYIMELLTSTREEYRVFYTDVTVVAGTAQYLIPERASGDKVRDVLMLSGSTYIPLSRVEPERATQSTQTGVVGGYYFEDNTLVLVPTPSSAGTLRVKYLRRPSALVATSAVATVNSIDATRRIITTSATIPSTIVSGIRVDIVDNNPGFRTHSMDLLTQATTSGTTITVTSDIPTSVASGDLVCLAGESSIAQCPVELHPLLAQRTAVKALEAVGDPKMSKADEICDRMARQAVGLLTPRSDGSARYLVNYNGPGWTGTRRR